MKGLGEKIYTNSWDYEVYAVSLRDVNSTRVSVDIYIISPIGEMSDLHTISRKDFITNKKSLDFIIDLDGDFTRDDIDAVRVALMPFFRKSTGNYTSIQTKATMKEIYQTVSNCIRDNAENLQDNINAEIFINDGFGYILTTKMKEFVDRNKELGYKKLEILQRLKVMGVLVVGNNRPYDILVSVGNEKKRFYKIKLADVQGEEEAEEEINIDNSGIQVVRRQNSGSTGVEFSPAESQGVLRTFHGVGIPFAEPSTESAGGY